MSEEKVEEYVEEAAPPDENYGNAYNWHMDLVESKEDMFFVKAKTGLDKNDIMTHMIGINGAKITFPIIDSKGDVIDVIMAESNGIDKAAVKDVLYKSYKPVKIQDSLSPDLHGQNITFSAIAIGKDLDPYIVPRSVSVKCSEVWLRIDAGKMPPNKCLGCILGNPSYLKEDRTIDKTYSIDQNTELLVNMVGMSDAQIKGEIRRAFNVPPYNKCRDVDMNITDRLSVEDVSLVSEINHAQFDSDYMMTRAFVFGKKVKPNQQYKLWGKVWNNPTNGKAMQVVHGIDSDRDNISKWKMTPERHEMLKTFQPRENTLEAITEKMDEINKDLAVNVTKIKKRDDVITITNMVYHSVLTFEFCGSRVTKGWMECAIMGDTRTGKTETSRALLVHMKAGEFISSAENTSLAGLLGGLQQGNNGKWNLTWGRLPMNDQRLALIDESDELAKNGTISHLSGVRSSGVAELIKINQQKTMSRVRLIFVTNPIHGRVADYNHGVAIIKDLFPEQQDISRVDVAVVCSKEDVSDAEINDMTAHEEVEHKYTSDLCHERVMFAWSMKPEKVKFTKSCELYILNKATQFGEKYSPEIPLIIGAEFRIKLARAAASVAAQMFSVDDDHNLIVDECHARYYVKWIQTIYDSDTFGYKDFSDQIRADKELKNEDKIEEIFRDTDQVNEILKAGQMTMADIQDIFSTADQQDAREKIGLLRKSNALKRSSGYYTKTPQFIRFLKNKRKRLKGDAPL